MRRLALTTIAALAAFGGVSGGALADTTGQQIATCAQMTLPPTGNAPSITCTCNGTTMTFPTFGAMVQHMLAMH